MREITYVQAIKEAYREEFARDKNVFIIGEDVKWGPHGTTGDLTNEFGEERVINTPISEPSFTGIGVGAACSGKRPIVEIMYSTFLYMTLDQVINQAAKIRYMTGGQAKVPMVIVTVTGYRGAGAGHHSDTVYPILMNVPGIIIIYPSNGYDGKGLLKSAVRDDNLVIFFHGANIMGRKCHVPDEEYLLPIGKASVVREGKDITVVAVGSMVEVAKAAADLLKDKVSVEIVDPRTILPLDKETVLQSVEKTSRVVVVEDIWPVGGLGAELAELVGDNLFGKLKAPLRRLTRPAVPMPFCPVLENQIVPSKEKLVALIEDTMKI